MVAVIDYDTGNLRSVCNALGRLGVDFELTADPFVIRKADKVLMPGVGEASSAMLKLRERGLDSVIPTLTQPVLGICLGLQLMCRRSDEGNTPCLSIFDTDVVRMVPDKKKGIKVPHMGWNRITSLKSPLLDGVKEGSYMYFVHSYAASLCDGTIAVSDNGILFSAALHKGNFYGVQFHPEKSGDAGALILKNFIAL
ncbi:MAG: imidazole glycerol phosphate synthase subunit HisH [Bacteroidales bacterium]|jgi:glutamine amidotransferase|nr:imidazole glycerol phosphate synthase subunit HisH [Bacteroidales bacterium]